MHLEHLSANVSGKVVRSIHRGRKVLIVPMTMIVPGVLNGSRGPLLYRPDMIAHHPASLWNAFPIVLNHPTKNGKPISARSPNVLNRYGMGSIYFSHVDRNNILKAIGYFDEEDTKRVSKKTYNALIKGKKVEVSTGVFTEEEPVPDGSTWNGKPYIADVKRMLPDHLAVLPDGVGACSIKDGCGLNTNEDVESAESSILSISDNEYTINPKGQWEPPNAGENAPNEIKRILKSVYSSCRDKNPKETTAAKSKCAKIAWGAVERAGWVKNDKGDWVKRKTSNSLSVNERNMKGSIWRKLGKVLGVTNQPSHDEIRHQLNGLIQERFGQKSPNGSIDMMDSPWVRDIFDKYLIYSHKGKLFQIGYTVDKKNDVVSLDEGEPKQVRRVIQFKPVENGANNGNDNSDVTDNDCGCNNKDKGDAPMPLTTEQRMQKIHKLAINNNVQHDVPWKGMDTTKLNAQSDDWLLMAEKWCDTLNNGQKEITYQDGSKAIYREDLKGWLYVPATNSPQNVQQVPVPQVPQVQPTFPMGLQQVYVPTPQVSIPTQPVGNNTQPQIPIAQPVPSPTNVKEWLDKAPSEVKQVVDLATQAVNQLKGQYISKLTDNIQDPEHKKQMVEIYSAMDPKHLQKMAEVYSNNAQQQSQSQNQQTMNDGGTGINFLLAGGAPVTHSTPCEEEPLLTPVYNFRSGGK